MGLFGNVFGGKKQGGHIVEQVMGMRQQGAPDGIIAQQLQSQGIPLPQIQDALNQADIKMRVGPPTGPPGAPPGGPPQMGQQAPQQEMGPPMGPPGPGEMVGQPGMDMMGPQMQGPSPEELIERIIEEKWRLIQEKFDKFEESKSEFFRQIQEMRDNLNDLRVKYAQLQEDSVVKIEEYNKELEGVGSQIKAMQRIMQNMIPVFAENVRQLNDIVLEMRGGQEMAAPKAPAAPAQQQAAPQMRQTAAAPFMSRSGGFANQSSPKPPQESKGDEEPLF